MSRDRRGLLRWYPARWRARYGDEMLALLDDQLGDEPAPLRLRLSLCGHGLGERARGLRPFGAMETREARWREGSLLVLVAWAAFMVGGAGFSKATEHFDQAVPAGSRFVPELAFSVVAVGGIVGGCLVLAGAALAVPGFVASLRTSCGRVVTPHLQRAIVVSALTVGATALLLVWGHRLNDAQRNGAAAGYGIAFVGWALLCTITVAAWTAVAVTVGRHVQLRRATLRAEAILASTLTAIMLAVLVASITWWAAIATAAPWFFDGAPMGTRRGSSLGLPVTLPISLAVFVMLAAATLGIVGTAHIHHGIPERSGDN